MDKIKNTKKQSIHFDQSSFPLTNDVFVKYTLASDDEDSDYLRKHIIYVYIPNINKVKTNKKLEEMNVMEKYVYILVNNLDDAILKEGSKVVKIMEKKKEMFLSDEELSLAAFQREIIQWENAHKEDEIKQKARILGMEEGKKEAYIMYVKTRFQEDISEYLEHLDSNKWEILEKNIYQVESLEELKEILK